MDICYFIGIGYFIVGLMLTFLWWKDEYEPHYELAKELDDGSAEPIAVLFIAALVFFWPVKLIKDYFETLFLS